jgi:hypothetical protein
MRMGEGEGEKGRDGENGNRRRENGERKRE